MGSTAEQESGVYKIENKVNGKVYVGSSKNIRIRKNGHLHKLRKGIHQSNLLQDAFNEYGEENFKLTVLEYCSEDSLLDKEAEWVKRLESNNREKGYNVRIHVTSNKGIKHTVESKRKMSEGRKGKGRHPYNLTEEDRESRRERGRLLSEHHTEETELRRLTALREALEGKSISDEHKDAIGRKNRGEKNGQSKLTEEDVVSIKILLREGKHSQQEIADMFGVSRRLIRFIRSGDRWAHVRIPGGEGGK